jgi:hypothetical protein
LFSIVHVIHYCPLSSVPMPFSNSSKSRQHIFKALCTSIPYIRRLLDIINNIFVRAFNRSVQTSFDVKMIAMANQIFGVFGTKNATNMPTNFSERSCLGTQGPLMGSNPWKDTYLFLFHTHDFFINPSVHIDFIQSFFKKKKTNPLVECIKGVYAMVYKSTCVSQVSSTH